MPLYRTNHFRSKENIRRWNDIKQQIDTLLMIDAGIKENIAKHALIQIGNSHVLGDAAKPPPGIGHSTATMRNDDFQCREIFEHIRRASDAQRLWCLPPDNSFEVVSIA